LFIQLLVLFFEEVIKVKVIVLEVSDKKLALRQDVKESEENSKELDLMLAFSDEDASRLALKLPE
jgi:hypothetical protein